MPTTARVDPVECAEKLGNFVLENNLDGVDVNWEDNHAMEAGTGEQWLITFTQRLRSKVPNHILTHCPQAPYFCAERYKHGAYVNVHKQVGHLIDFYNVQFYNQGNNTYDSYQKLFVESGGHFPGTSVKEISQRGIPLDKIVVGKPVTTGDATNTGYMDKHALGEAVVRAYKEGNWHAGVMFWQFISDTGGQTINAACSQLKQLCEGKH
jgi:chitinase